MSGLAMLGILFAVSLNGIPQESDEVIPRADLVRYAKSDPRGMLSDARIRCRLEVLMTAGHLSALEERLQLISADSDAGAGGVAFEGGVRGLYTIMEGIVIVLPNGLLWAAYIDNGKVLYFGSAPSVSKKLIAAVEKWRKRFADYPVIIMSPTPSADEIEQRCGGSK